MTDRSFTVAALIPDDHFTLTHDGQVITDVVVEMYSHVREGEHTVTGHAGTYRVPTTTPVVVHN